MAIIFVLFAVFFLKHYVIDFPLQTEYQWRNKGTFLHPGGLLHSGLHALFTMSLLLLLAVPAALIIAVCEFIAHYLIDYFKMNINKDMGWDANKNPEFWYLLGFDQLLHYLTYLLIVYYAVIGLGINI